MTRTIILKTIMASTYKPNSKPLNGDKTLGTETAIYSYEIEDGANTEEVE